jgi:hypothetical protein
MTSGPEGLEKRYDPTAPALGLVFSTGTSAATRRGLRQHDRTLARVETVTRRLSPPLFRQCKPWKILGVPAGLSMSAPKALRISSLLMGKTLVVSSWLTPSG